jgi:hypothetical protein
MFLILFRVYFTSLLTDYWSNLKINAVNFSSVLKQRYPQVFYILLAFVKCEFSLALDPIQRENSTLFVLSFFLT